MDRDAALEKIRKCLALSSSPNENEARTALLMARRLMAEYKIGSGEEIAEGQMPEQRMSSITYTTIRDNWVPGTANSASSTSPATTDTSSLTVSIVRPCICIRVSVRTGNPMPYWEAM